MAPVVVISIGWRAFAPLEGFCPLDIFHVKDLPSAHSLLVWRWASSILFIALVAGGLLKRPLAIAVLVLAYLSPALILFRFLTALGHGPGP